MLRYSHPQKCVQKAKKTFIRKYTSSRARLFVWSPKTRKTLYYVNFITRRTSGLLDSAWKSWCWTNLNTRPYAVHSLLSRIWCIYIHTYMNIIGTRTCNVYNVYYVPTPRRLCIIVIRIKIAFRRIIIMRLCTAALTVKRTVVEYYLIYAAKITSSGFAKSFARAKKKIFIIKVFIFLFLTKKKYAFETHLIVNH